MKRLFISIPIIAVIAAMTSSCTKYYNTYGSQMMTREYTVTPAQWQRNEGDNLPGGYNYLYVDLVNEDITQQVVDAGAVQAFVWNIYDTFENLGAWNTLPYVIPIEITTTTDGNVSTAIVAENMRFEWEKNKVTLVIQDLDGFDPEDMVSTFTVRVCVTL